VLVLHGNLPHAMHIFNATIHAHAL